MKKKKNKDEEIKRLTFELEEAKKKQDEESEIFVLENNSLRGEVKKKDVQIKRLTSELEKAQKRVQELEQQAHESTILEEEFETLSTR